MLEGAGAYAPGAAGRPSLSSAIYPLPSLPMLGPVFRHEMLAAGRKPRYVWFRVLIGLGMLLLLAIGYQVAVEQVRYRQIGPDASATTLSIAGASMLATVFYQQFAWATMIGVLLVTPAVAAGAIASERERRTIEYLFATDLSNAEIVVDKLAARLLTIGLLVLATLPVLALFRLLGGVPGDVLLRHFAILASTATLTAAIAITRGVWCERARDAVPVALSAVFIWLIASPLLELILLLANTSPYAWAQLLGDAVAPLAVAMREIHPIWILAASSGASQALGVDTDTWAIGRMIFWQLVTAAALLAVGVANVRRVHLRGANSSVKRAKEKGRGDKRPVYERRPLLWKEMFASSAPKRGSKLVRTTAVVLFTLAVSSPLVMMLVIGVRRGARGFEDYMQMALGLVLACGTIVALMLGNRAAGLVSHERERETWPTLLTTPLTAREILMAKAWGNLYAFRWGIVGVSLIPLLGAWFDLRALLSCVGVLVTLLVVGWAATWIGLTTSIRQASSVKSVAIATFVMIAIGGLYSGVAGAMLALAGADGDAIPILVLPPLVPMLLAIPCVVMVEGTDGMIPVVYLLGMIFYAGLSFALQFSAISRFDWFCGRGDGGGDAPTAGYAAEAAAGPAPSPGGS